VNPTDLEGPPDEVARSLLGAHLVAGGVVIRITEVEAYGGSDDAASHAFRGRTNRNAVMFGPPGHLYVYLSYGIHCCANVVCGPEGIATAVLLRAGTAVEGEGTIRSRRGEGVPAARLLDGPGKLCQALGIDRSFDGADLLAPRGRAQLLDGARVAGERVVESRRIGISKETERPWRFQLLECG
jgi:DNA-3-methyladenine glycosylase